MSLAAAFNQLGQTVIPAIGAAAFPDTMDIMVETVGVGAGGGRIKSATASDYENIPVAYEPMQVETRLTSGDKAVSIQQYMLTFPTHYKWGRIDIDPKTHRLKVLERGSEPEKTFRIVSIRDQMGVVFEAVCDREN